MSDESDSDLEPQLLGNIAELQRQIDEDSSEEEIDAHEQCVDKAIALNDSLHAKLRRMLAMCQRMLRETRNKLQDVKYEIQEQSTNAEARVFKPRQFGVPYFRDSQGRKPPPNTDTLMKTHLGMESAFSFNQGNGWAIKDKEDLLQIILKLSRLKKKEKLKELLNKMSGISMDARARQLYEEDLQKQITNVNKAQLSEVALPINEEYDWDTIAFNLEHRHTASELRAMWKLHLHPSLRQENLSRVEYCLLQNLIHQNNRQNWDQIADDLGGRRSGYQCFVLYRTVITDTNKGAKWTPEEDEFLRQNVEFYRNGNFIPWSTISTCFKNRTKMQIYNRYCKTIKANIKKGRFLPEEDAVIMAAYDLYGHDFRKISQYIPGRSVAQIRNRYDMSLQRKSAAVWTVEEDKKLIHFINGMKNDSVNYANAAKHFQNRDRAAIRARHLTLKKWMMANPNADIRSAPRRPARVISAAKIPNLELRKAVENLVNRLETEMDENTRNYMTEYKEVPLMDAILNVFIKCAKETNNMNYLGARIRGSDASTSKSRLEHSSHNPTKNTEKENNKLEALTTILLALKSNLIKNHFYTCSLANEYPRLLSMDSDESPRLRMKTYSRKTEPDQVITEKISVWNDTKCYAVKLALGANYGSLCACKVLLQDTCKLTKLRRSLYIAGTLPLRINYQKLVERCMVVFSWPLSFSNTPPIDFFTSIHDNTVETIVPEINVAEAETQAILSKFAEMSYDPKFATGTIKYVQEVNPEIDLPIMPLWLSTAMQSENNVNKGDCSGLAKINWTDSYNGIDENFGSESDEPNKSKPSVTIMKKKL